MARLLYFSMETSKQKHEQHGERRTFPQEGRKHLKDVNVCSSKAQTEGWLYQSTWRREENGKEADRQYKTAI